MSGRMRVAMALAFAFVALAGAGPAAAFTAHGSAEQVYVTGLSGGQSATLLNAAGHKVTSAKADSLGGLLFRSVKPGAGYRVRPAGGTASAPVTVLSDEPAPPSTSIYDQKLPTSGYGYLTTRDGTKLAIDVHPPTDVTSALGVPLPSIPLGPSPTLIEYSGYGYADPAGPQNGIATVANLMGFTVVDVNMRGTGCSGGAFDFFEALQSLDGYDVIETVARQPWVLHHKVGMMGISYGGISQLFTAQTDPPSLAAIAPLSVIDQTQTTLYPGGILNTGFAVEWAKERVHDGLPASPTGGQSWAYKRIQQGDQICKDDQTMHGEAVDLLAKVRANNHYVPKVADPLSPITFVDKITAPVFMACQWTDEQTGGHCPDLAEHFTGTQHKWFTFTNGAHVDSLDPATLNRMYDFLMLYVAQRAPLTGSAVLQLTSPIIYQVAMGISGVTLPPDPIQTMPSVSAAKAAFDSLPEIRVLFDNGAGGSKPGEPYPGFERSFSSFPIPGTVAKTWQFPVGVQTFNWNSHATALTDFTGDTAAGTNGLWTATPPYQWKPDPPGTSVSYTTDPLASDTTAIGAGSVNLWVRASKSNVDLQVTISEIRSDGKETFVQGGWLRANERKLDKAKSTPLEPVLSLRTKDVRPLRRGRYSRVTIPLYYEGHAYRQGSRIRVTVSAPNGNQPIWSFAEASPKGQAKVYLASPQQSPASLTLPIVPGLSIPTPLPPCPGLRGEPCR